ncbi:hypothetical protein P4534_23130 [Peribacillus butanolivorans]|uniref:hypothetical protein n=1 Tax=Peribacillus butanolivorans TaxID=421767 RepID=UPI002E1B39F3|nr:hypothetical protein [Peribacillus butanolivorans]
MLLQPITDHAKIVHYSFNEKASISRKITVIALLSTMAATLQAAGGLIPAAGLFINPLATSPAILSMVLLVRYGLLGYLLTLFLLFSFSRISRLIGVCNSGQNTSISYPLGNAMSFGLRFLFLFSFIPFLPTTIK